MRASASSMECVVSSTADGALAIRSDGARHVGKPKTGWGMLGHVSISNLNYNRANRMFKR